MKERISVLIILAAIFMTSMPSDVLAQRTNKTGSKQSMEKNSSFKDSFNGLFKKKEKQPQLTEKEQRQSLRTSYRDAKTDVKITRKDRKVAEAREKAAKSRAKAIKAQRKAVRNDDKADRKEDSAARLRSKADSKVNEKKKTPW